MKVRDVPHGNAKGAFFGSSYKRPLIPVLHIRMLLFAHSEADMVDAFLTIFIM